jgi:hypothetical protein
MKTNLNARKQARRTNYRRISNDLRLLLINMVYKEKKAIHQAAKELKINYSTAKTIMRVFRQEKRTTNRYAEEEEMLKKILLQENTKNKKTKTNQKDEQKKCATCPEIGSTCDSIPCRNFIRSKGLLILASVIRFDFKEIDSLCLNFFEAMKNMDNLNIFNNYINKLEDNFDERNNINKYSIMDSSSKSQDLYFKKRDKIFKTFTPKQDFKVFN